MSATKKNQDKDGNVLAESEDGFQYEEVSLDDDWSLTEGEEDLEAMVKAIRDRAEASAAAAAGAADAAPLRPNATSITHQPEAVDDFLRNFLFQKGMTETLDCFQTEWTEMAQKGLVDPVQAGVVPGVYIENQRLDCELKNAHREGEEYRLAASAAAETLMRVQRARDFHRLQHKRVVQEKNRLVEEIRKLKVQCDDYEPVVKRKDEKYRAVLKQTVLRDKASEQENSCWVQRAAQHPVIQPTPPTSENSPTSHARVHNQIVTK